MDYFAVITSLNIKMSGYVKLLKALNFSFHVNPSIDLEWNPFTSDN